MEQNPLHSKDMEYGVPKLYSSMWEGTIEEDYDESEENSSKEGL